VRLVNATIYRLCIPFLTPVRHSLAGRTWSDSVVVRVQDADGGEGFGEAAPRPYVTGETPEDVVAHLTRVLWPAVAGMVAPDLEDSRALDVVPDLVPDSAPAAGRHHAARAALELAIVDWALRRRRRSASALLPPRRRGVVYAGAITAEAPVEAARQARWARLAGLRHVKVKVGVGDDVARIRAVREALGPDAVVRADANGAWSPAEARTALRALAGCGIASVEQPIAPGCPETLARVRAESPLPLVADESAVTLEDVVALIAARAVDAINVRVSKCGGFARSVAIARRAAAAGLEVQVGSHVGETAILAAAGRHLAAGLDRVAFVEGSYGTLLLVEDVSDDGLRFGYGGAAPLLTGPGWGVRVRVDRLRRHARAVVELAA
jgi:muconate cycloisomerase